MRAARRGESFENIGGGTPGGPTPGGPTPGGPAPVPHDLREESKEVNPSQFASNAGSGHIPTPGGPSDDFNQPDYSDPYSGYQTKLGNDSQSSDEGYQNMDNPVSGN